MSDRQFTSATAREAFARAEFLGEDEPARPDPAGPEIDDHLCAACHTAGAVVMCTTATDIEWRHRECLRERN